MNQNLLLLTAATLGFVHTLFGPDHYVPFIAISKAKNWSLTNTIFVTFFCGIGHVLGSVILGLIGIFSGIALDKLSIIESFRGTIAAYLLIIFGLFYTIYGLRKAYLKKPHKHIHFHANGMVHNHMHIHKEEHKHVHNESKDANITPWLLFIIFIFGPCEVLIPLVMYPAAQNDFGILTAVILVFAASTIGTMLVLVVVGLKGIKLINLKSFEKYTHALAGLTILICGIAIRFLGL